MKKLLMFIVILLISIPVYAQEADYGAAANQREVVEFRYDNAID